MEQRRLGNQGLIVSAMGLGCMGMSDAYGPADEAESIATITGPWNWGLISLIRRTPTDRSPTRSWSERRLATGVTK